MTDSDPPKPRLRWCRPTPGRFLVFLLAVEGFLLLSERFRWFGFNEHKNWTVLIALAVVGAAAVVLALWFVAALLLRRRFQFSLRSLLVLAVVVALPCSWLAVKMQQAKRQTEAVQALRAAEVARLISYNLHWSETTPLPKPQAPPWLVELLGVDFFTDVLIVVSEGMSDDDLKNLAVLTNLKVLWLHGPQITDAGLEHLRGLTKLEVLCLLECPKVTDAGLEYLKGLANLEELVVDCPQVTDAGLEHLKGLIRLKGLGFNGARVTDAGLEHLKGLTKLEVLLLDNTQVTDEGVKRLQEALPTCTIQHEPLPVGAE